jgi:hypothetical protein
VAAHSVSEFYWSFACRPSYPDLTENNMSFLLAAPEALGSAATDVAGIGSTLNAASSAAASQTTGIVAAAQDEVSAAIAALFSGHGLAFQALNVQAATFHDEFVQALSASAGAYASSEAANVSPLQQLLNVINAPIQTLTGRPLIGNGAGGAVTLWVPVPIATPVSSECSSCSGAQISSDC